LSHSLAALFGVLYLSTSIGLPPYAHFWAESQSELLGRRVQLKDFKSLSSTTPKKINVYIKLQSIQLDFALHAFLYSLKYMER